MLREQHELAAGENSAVTRLRDNEIESMEAENAVIGERYAQAISLASQGVLRLAQQV